MFEDLKELTGFWFWAIAMILVTVVVFGTCHFVSKPLQVLDKVTDPTHIISSYEEFQEIYNTTQTLCTQIQIVDETVDSESGGFSKSDRVAALKQKLSVWVETYNAKSKMITRNNWKSTSLPHQLNFKTVCD